MLDLLALPSAFLVGLFRDHLGLYSLVKLDTACCSKASRTALCAVVDDGGFWLSDYMTLEDRRMKWCIGRRVKVSKIWVAGSDFSVEIMTEFLRIGGACIEKLWIADGPGAVLLAAVFTALSLTAQRLRVLMIMNCDEVDSTALTALLSVSLHSLRGLGLTQSNFALPASIPPMPKMELLEIFNCKTDNETLCALVSACPGLRSFCCNNLNGSNSCLNALASHCPHLQIFSHANIDPQDVTALVRIFHACPKIEFADILVDDVRSCTATDAHIAAILQHCRKLKALCIPASGANITDASIMAVASRLGDLRHLWLHDIVHVDDQPLLALTEHCQNLETLMLHAQVDIASDAALVALARKLQNVTELSVQGLKLTDRVLAAIASHCPHLKTLDLFDCHGYTDIGIVAVAQGCPALKRVHVGKNDECMTPAARLLWEDTHPGLEFSEDDHLMNLWTEMHDLSRDELVIW